MIETKEASLRSFLSRDSGTKSSDALFESEQTLAELREQVRKAAPLAAGGLGGVVMDGLLAAVDVPLTRILAGAWNGWHALLEYRDPARHPPEESALVPVAKHVITSKHRPSIEVLLDGRKIGSATFELVLTLEVEAGLLRIQNARILELRSARIVGKASLALEGAKLKQLSSGPLDLPEVLSFGAGIPIGAPTTSG